MIMKFINYTLTVAWKEIQVISRERVSLMILFLLPLLVGGFMGGGNLVVNRSEGDAIQLDVGMVNLDRNAMALDVVNVFKSIDQLQVSVYPTEAEVEEQVSKGNLAAAIIIPADFSQKIDEYAPGSIEVIVDPAEPESAGIVTGIVKQVVSEFALQGEVLHGIRSILSEAGILQTASAEESRAIEAQNKGVIMTRINEMRTNPVIALSIENPTGEKTSPSIEIFFAYLFPGLTVYFIFFIVGMSANALLTERDNGTLRRLLSAPIPKGAILAGKILAYMFLACMQVVVIFSVANFAFHTPLGNSPLGLVIMTLAVAFNATTFGMMIAALSKTAKQADSIGTVLGFVLGSLGGAIAFSATPFYRSGGIVGTLAKLTPQNHGVEGFYQLMAENASFIQILPQIGILMGMGIVFFGIALWRFKFDG
jgi:linearmycin/streptolysin S transport system permease protein